MRHSHPSSLRSSVCAGFTVVLTALLAWTFDLYTPYVNSSAGDTVASDKVLASVAAIGCDARDA